MTDEGVEAVDRSDGDAPKAAFTSWESMRRFGQVVTMTILTSFLPGELRRLRGPSVRRSGGQTGPHPLFDPGVPLRILLAPDLQGDDATVQLLVNLADRKGIEIHAHDSVADRFGSSAIRRWSVIKHEQVVTIRWRDADRDRDSLISMDAHLDTSSAVYLLKEIPSFPMLEHWAAGLAWARDYDSPIHLTATRLPNAVWERTTNSGLADIGLSTPEEALMAAMTVMHRNERFVVEAGQGFLNIVDPFYWYSGLAQLAMPWYRSLFTLIVNEREARGADRSPDLQLDCLQGLLVRVRQLLKIHDRLAWLSLVETYEVAKNQRVDEQADLVFDAVNSVNGALDGLVVWLVEREGIDTGRDSRSVGFPSLRAKDPRKWVGALSRYPAAVTVLQGSLHPIMELASDLRVKGYHFHPLLTSVLQFPELLEVTEPDGSPRWVTVHEETAGAVQVGQPLADELGLQYGVDGFLVLPDAAFALPLGFVRGLLREFLRLLDQVLAEVAKVEGVAIDLPSQYFPRRSPYAEFALDFGRQLEMTPVEVFGDGGGETGLGDRPGAGTEGD